MNTSLDHLPADKRELLGRAVDTIRAEVPEDEWGSARVGAGAHLAGANVGGEPAGAVAATSGSGALDLIEGARVAPGAPPLHPRSGRLLLVAARLHPARRLPRLHLLRPLDELADRITEHVPALAARDRRFAAITLADLVDMRLGIAFVEALSFPWVIARVDVVAVIERGERPTTKGAQTDRPPQFIPRFSSCILSDGSARPNIGRSARSSS